MNVKFRNFKSAIFSFKLLALALTFSSTAVQAQARKNDTVQAENGKPALAVFVVGLKNPGVEDYFSSLIGNELARGNSYEIIPRTEAIKRKLAELREYEDAGHIDDRELTEWGRQNNVSMLCLVQIVYLDEYLFSVQLTDVKSNRLVGSAEYAIPSATGNDLKKAASAIAARLKIKPKK
jgi:hypothetical protein